MANELDQNWLRLYDPRRKGQSVVAGAIDAVKDAAIPGAGKAGKQPLSGETGGAGGSWKTTYVDSGGQRRTGTVEYDDPYWSQMRDYYNRMYDSQVSANDARAEELSAQAARSAEEQKQRLAAGYQSTNRQLYRDYMDRQRALPQQLAAQGYNGGLSESARLRLNNAYEESLAENERARLSRESEISSAQARSEQEARSAAAQANRQAEQNRYAYLAALRGQEYQQQRADAANRAAVLAEAGDFSGYGALGLSQEDVDYLAKMWRARNPRLAGVQSTGAVQPPARSTLAGNSVAQVADYLRRTRGLDTAVDYVAEELAAGNLFSDEAERIWQQLRG